MRFAKLVALSSLTLLGITAAPACKDQSARILVCDLGTLTTEQRARHTAVTKRLLAHATRKEMADGYLFFIDRSHISAAELAEWVADESRCCPAVDFHIELPASGLLTLRLSGGAEVKEFIAAELRL